MSYQNPLWSVKFSQKVGRLREVSSAQVADQDFTKQASRHLPGAFTVLSQFDCAKLMKNVYSADFYQGWLIEIIQIEEGFQSICYSPCWEKFSSLRICDSDFEAISVARSHINQYGACYSLASMLRELYETEHLSFEEWRSLQQSLQQSLAKTITAS